MAAPAPGSTRTRSQKAAPLRSLRAAAKPPRVPAFARRFAPSWATSVRGRPRLLHDTLAVSPVIGTVMILGISAIGIAGVLSWGLPNIQQTQAVTELDGVRNQFFALDQISDGVMRGGAIGKASQGSLSIPEGSIERTNGTLFQVTWFPNNTATPTDRFWVSGVADATPETFTIAPQAGTSTLNRYVLVERIVRHAATPVLDLTPVAGWGTPEAIEVNLGSVVGLEDQVTRIRVMEIATPDDTVLMETWLLPSGSLSYNRMTPFGLAGYRLENSAVISELEQGDFMRNTPLGTVERNSAGEPTFLGLFHVIFVDNSTFPGVQGSGAGSYPILFSLDGNQLRANIEENVAVQIDAHGPRGPLWEDFYTNNLGMVATNTVYPGVGGAYLEASTYAPGLYRGFTFVLLESVIEVTLKLDTVDLGRAS